MSMSKYTTPHGCGRCTCRSVGLIAGKRTPPLKTGKWVQNDVEVAVHPVEVPEVDQRPKQVGAVHRWLDVMVLEEPEWRDPVRTWRVGPASGTQGAPGTLAREYGSQNRAVFRAPEMVTDQHRATHILVFLGRGVNLNHPTVCFGLLFYTIHK